MQGHASKKSIRAATAATFRPASAWAEKAEAQDFLTIAKFQQKSA
jgi:hypothetical protein